MEEPVDRVSGGEPGPGNTARGRRLVLVPRRVGPLRPLNAEPDKTGDDLDILIDDVFGPSTDERPGRFDVALVVVGIVLLVWAVLGGGALALLVGGSLIALGLALPARGALRAARSTRISNRERAAMASGLALDVTDPSVAALVRAYDALRAVAAQRAFADGEEAAAAGHAALLEVASLLAGRVPEGVEERQYVRRRTSAISELTVALDRSSRRRPGPRPATASGAGSGQADAVVRAREELEATTGTGAVADLDRIREGLVDRSWQDA